MRSIRTSFIGTSFTALAIYAFTAVNGALLARLFGPQIRGELATVILYPNLLITAGVMGGPLVLARRTAREPHSAPRSRVLGLHWGLFTGVVSATLAVLLERSGLAVDKQYLFVPAAIFAAVIPLEHIRLNLLGIDHGLGEFPRYNLMRLIGAAAPSVLVGLGALLGTKTLPFLVLLYMMAYCLPLLTVAWGRLPRLGCNARELRSFGREALPYGVSTVVSDLYMRLDVILMQWLAPVVVLGYYMAAVSAAAGLLLLPNVAALYVFKFGAETSSSKHGQGSLLRALLLTGFVQAVSAASLWLALPWLIPLVFGKAFVDATPYARALVAPYALLGVNAVIDSYLRGQGRPAVGMMSRLCGCLAMLAGALFTYRSRGALAIPFGALVGSAVATIATAMSALRVDLDSKVVPEPGGASA